MFFTPSRFSVFGRIKERFKKRPAPLSLRKWQRSSLFFLITPARGDSRWFHLSRPAFFLLCFLLSAYLIAMLALGGRYFYLHYTTSSLEQNKNTKQKLLAQYQGQLKAYSLSYAVKENYLNNTFITLPSLKEIANFANNQTLGKLPTAVGGNSENLDEKNYSTVQQLASDFLQEKKLSFEAREEGTNKTVYNAIENELSALGKNLKLFSAFNHLLSGRKEALEHFPSLWPLKGGVGRPVRSATVPAVKQLALETLPGSYVVATAQGRVTAVEFDAARLAWRVVVTHRLGFKTSYRGLKQSFVEVGAVVEKGEALGTAGRRVEYRLRLANVLLAPERFAVIKY